MLLNSMSGISCCFGILKVKCHIWAIVYNSWLLITDASDGLEPFETKVFIHCYRWGQLCVRFTSSIISWSWNSSIKSCHRVSRLIGYWHIVHLYLTIGYRFVFLCWSLSALGFLLFGFVNNSLRYRGWLLRVMETLWDIGTVIGVLLYLGIIAVHFVHHRVFISTWVDILLFEVLHISISLWLLFLGSHSKVLILCQLFTYGALFLIVG